MSRQILAVALCRVSSLEQLQNNSLKHQRDNVLKAADELGAIIPSDGIWAGQASSKEGVNYNRKDLLQIYEYCKKHTTVRYLIVQEVDRFMRSAEEQTYWYVRFWYELKVRVWFADKSELNEQTHVASLLRFMEGWRAGGSNLERKNKSINGQTAALKEGRYTFCPKPGYKRGTQPGIHEIHTLRGPALQKVLLDIVSKRVTPTQGLIDLNKSPFMQGHSVYKMDKFRKIATDIYYAGGVEIDKQVKAFNLNGLHEPLITLEQHYELVRIFDSKKKNQAGPRKNGNPKYPTNNIVHCDSCVGRRYNRFVGVDITNGKSPRLYEKYRCRACKRWLTREEMHTKIARQFRDNPITDTGVHNLTKALETVWKRREGENQQDIVRLRHKLASLKDAIGQQVEAATDPENVMIKADILANIAKRKEEAQDIESQLNLLSKKTEGDYEQFLRFAFGFAADMSKKFLDPNTSQENRLRCKQIIFPAGFRLDTKGNVYTPEISELIRLQAKKKDAEASDDSHLVRVRGL